MQQWTALIRDQKENNQLKQNEKMVRFDKYQIEIAGDWK